MVKVKAYDGLEKKERRHLIRLYKAMCYLKLESITMKEVVKKMFPHV